MIVTQRGAAMPPGRNYAHNVRDVDPLSFGGQLRRLRLDAGLTQEQLAAAIGLPQTRISEYERSKYVPSEKIIRQLAEALGVRPALLFEASAWDGVLPIGDERRKRLARLEERDWELFDDTMRVMHDLTPEERARFARTFRDFLETWRAS